MRETCKTKGIRTAYQHCCTVETGMATHSSNLAWRIPWTEEPGKLYSSWGHKESDMTEWLTHTHTQTDTHSQFGRGQGLVRPPHTLPALPTSFLRGYTQILLASLGGLFLDMC